MRLIVIFDRFDSRIELVYPFFGKILCNLSVFRLLFAFGKLAAFIRCWPFCKGSKAGHKVEVSFALGLAFHLLFMLNRNLNRLDSLRLLKRVFFLVSDHRVMCFQI